MSLDVQNASGGSSDQTGSSGAADPTTTQTQQTQDKVEYASYKKVLDEKKARDRENAELKRQIEEINAAKRAEEEKKLTESGDLSKILKLKEEALKTLQKEHEGLKQTLTQREQKEQSARKISAVLNSVNGEIPQQYWGLIDTDQIAIDPETGKPEELSVKKAVEDFEKTYPHVIVKADGTRLPNEAPRGAKSKSPTEMIRAAKTQKELDEAVRLAGLIQ